MLVESRSNITKFYLPFREIEDTDFDNIIEKTNDAIPWSTIKNMTRIKNPTLEDIYSVFGISPSMHLIVAAFDKQDLRNYHDSTR